MAMTLLPRRVTRLLLAAVLLTAGCGSDGSLSAGQRDRLEARIAAAREAAGARDAAAVRRELTRFRADVRRAREAGDVSEQDAGRLLALALTAQRRAGAEITPAPTPAPTATARAGARHPGAEARQEEGQGPGQGQGR